MTAPALRNALQATMEIIDENAQKFDSGLYCTLANQMKAIWEGIDDAFNNKKREFAMELVLDVPACASASVVSEFINDPNSGLNFMRSLVHKKALRESENTAFEKALSAIDKNGTDALRSEATCLRGQLSLHTAYVNACSKIETFADTLRESSAHLWCRMTSGRRAPVARRDAVAKFGVERRGRGRLPAEMRVEVPRRNS